MPRKTWRCFHCDDVFTRPQDAAEHFGGTQGSLTGCQIKGTDGELLALVRKQEEELRRLRSEDGDYARVMSSMRCEHDIALRRAEEVGFGRGVTEMQDLARKQFGQAVAL